MRTFVEHGIYVVTQASSLIGRAAFQAAGWVGVASQRLRAGCPLDLSGWKPELRRWWLTLFVLVFFSAVVARAADEKDANTLFGSAKRSAGALIGILYDFKQNQKRQQTPMDRHIFEQVVAQFIDSGWDEGLLNQYYRVPRALYATELQINTIDADTAPRAFGVEKTVEPRTWLVHYKGQVAAPEDGTYRFLGDADDFVAVAVNDQTELVADIPGTRLKVKWFAKETTELHGRFGGRYMAGDWIDLKAGKPIDLDIITGESPGGQFRCLLLVEKKGVTYAHGEAPAFQLTLTKNSLPDAHAWKGVP
ncbi:MAG: hypothetical protein H0X40_00530 [Chthoniobacterales bacterium]|nr:hypothetical protein [Chthoniobacterales bacterium]